MGLFGYERTYYPVAERDICRTRKSSRRIWSPDGVAHIGISLESPTTLAPSLASTQIIQELCWNELALRSSQGLSHLSNSAAEAYPLLQRPPVNQANYAPYSTIPLDSQPIVYEMAANYPWLSTPNPTSSISVNGTQENFIITPSQRSPAMLSNGQTHHARSQANLASAYCNASQPQPIPHLLTPDQLPPLPSRPALDARSFEVRGNGHSRSDFGCISTFADAGHTSSSSLLTKFSLRNLRSAASVPNLAARLDKVPNKALPPSRPSNSIYQHTDQSKSRFRLRPIPSASNLAVSLADQLHQAAESVVHLDPSITQNPGMMSRITTSFNDIIGEIDDEIVGDTGHVPDTSQIYPDGLRSLGPLSATANLVKAAGGAQTCPTSFSKVWLYANSRLPPHLPPLKMYMPTYPLLCLAAQYSSKVYDRPTLVERKDYIDGSLWHQTKTMTLKSVPVDDMNTIVFAIRGSSSIMDWAVNFRPEPSSPSDFLDDAGNFCHAGFLSIARGMIKPVAARLRTLLAENPGRSTSSLLITGHSAGGAVAQLLYAHMLSCGVNSELNYLTGFFKRVHCITFGAPPVSLLPLTTPSSRATRKSLFFAFINEGDPVARADKAVIRSLLKLYAHPAPSSTSFATNVPSGKTPCKWTRPSAWVPNSSAASPLIWPVPDSTLSLGGRVILLRPKLNDVRPDNIEAVTVDDEILRDVVFGDPACHSMTMYLQRVEIIATQAVTVGAFR